MLLIGICGFGGCLLIAAAIIGLTRGDVWIRSHTAPQASGRNLEPLDAFLTDESGGRGEYPWNRYRVTIAGREYEVLVREYERPVELRAAMARVPTATGSASSAFAVFSKSVSLGRQIKGKADLQAYAQLFDDPTGIMTWYEKIQVDAGGWGGLVRGIRSSSDREFESMRLVGEARVGSHHIFVVKMPDAEIAFRVVKCIGSGNYRLVQEWDDEVRPVLYNSKVLDLFHTVHR